jgi:two-component system nitrate/nitrite response regulator NarL
MCTSDVIRIVIADDHAIVREGLTRLLESEPGFRVIGAARDGREAIDVTTALQPDVLLLDLTMPRVPGLDALKALAARSSTARTIVLTAGVERDDLVTAVQVGARGVVLKDCASGVLFESIRCVMQDQYWLGRDTVADLVHALRRVTAQPEAAAPTHRFRLTARELQVVAAAAAGESNKEISERLSISEATVKHHLSNIFDKLGVFSRVELAIFAVNHGLTPDSCPLPQ